MARTTLKLPMPKAEPVRVTRRQKAKFLAIFEQDLQLVHAAEEADIDLEDLNNELKDDPEFRLQKQAAEMRMAEVLQKRLFDGAKAGDPTLIRAGLKALMPSRYGDQQQINININSADDLKGKSREELLELREKCQKLKRS